MKNQINFLKNIDLFSIPFSFSVGGKQNKQTILGGGLSLIVLSIAFVYFYYLMKMYFTNQLEPKITSRSFIDDQKSGILIEKDQLLFEFLINGEPLKKYEKRVGKTYLSYLATFTFYNLDGTWDSTKIPLKECQLKDFEGFLTFDDKSIMDKVIMIDPLSMTDSNLEIEVQPCDPFYESNCANNQEVLDVIFQPYNYLQTFTKIQQFNPNSRKFEDQYRSEYMYLDPHLSLYSRFNLMKGKTIVKEGILIQSEYEKEALFNFKKIDSLFSNKYLYKNMGSVEYALILYNMDQNQTLIAVQFPMITEVFAQFTCILNSLLLIGIVAKMLGQSSIVEELNEVLLKGYYKKTAVKLFKSSQTEMSQSQINNLDKKYDSIFELQKKINGENFCKQKRKFFKLRIVERFKIFFLQFFRIIDKRKSLSGNLEDDHEKQIYLKLRNESLKKINIFEVLRDLYKIKMAIKLMLTKEQYAAIQFCGSEISVEDSPNQQIEVQQSKNKNDRSKENENNQEIVSKINNQFPSCFQCGLDQQLPIINLSSIEPIASSQPKDSFFLDKMKFELQLSSQIPIQKENNLLRDIQSQGQQKDEIVIGQQDARQISKLLQQKSQLKKNNGDMAIDMKESQENFSEKKDIQGKQLNLDYPIQHLSEKSFEFIQKFESQSFQKAISSSTKQQKQRSHLEEMDLIEENLQIQEQYLYKFLNLQKEEEQSSNVINNQIFESLLINGKKFMHPIVQEISNKCHLSLQQENSIKISKVNFLSNLKVVLSKCVQKKRKKKGENNNQIE